MQYSVGTFRKPPSSPRVATSKVTVHVEKVNSVGAAVGGAVVGARVVGAKVGTLGNGEPVG